MKRHSFGRSCLMWLLLGGASVFLVLFIGSVIFSQSQAGEPKMEGTLPSTAAATVNRPPEAATPPVSLTAAPPVIGVTIESSPSAEPGQSTAAPELSSTISVQPTELTSVTPGSAPLGTLDYPLTVTAEAYSAATKVAVFLNSVKATRTANAREAEIAHVTLTAASSPK